MHGAVEVAFKHQDELLERSISLAKQFNTGKVRCFDFWRLDDVSPYRAAIDEKLRSAPKSPGNKAFSSFLRMSSSAIQPPVVKPQEPQRRPDTSPGPQLGSRQRRDARRTRRLPCCLGYAAQGPHPPLPREKRQQAAGDDGKIEWAPVAPGSSIGLRSFARFAKSATRRRKPGNALARRWNF